MSYDAALRTYSPHFVVSCWMPMGQDWTASIRKTASVFEYILVGESDYGICGDPWRTWGSRGGAWGDGGGSESSSDRSEDGSSGDETGRQDDGSRPEPSKRCARLRSFLYSRTARSPYLFARQLVQAWRACTYPPCATGRAESRRTSPTGGRGSNSQS